MAHPIRSLGQDDNEPDVAGAKATQRTEAKSLIPCVLEAGICSFAGMVTVRLVIEDLEHHEQDSVNNAARQQKQRQYG